MKCASSFSVSDKINLTMTIILLILILVPFFVVWLDGLGGAR